MSLRFHPRHSEGVILSEDGRRADGASWKYTGTVFSSSPLNTTENHRFVFRADSSAPHLIGGVVINSIGVTSSDPSNLEEIPWKACDVPKSWCVTPRTGVRFENSEEVDTRKVTKVTPQEGDVWCVEVTPGGQVYIYHNYNQPWASPVFTLPPDTTQVWAVVSLFRSTISVVQNPDTETLSKKHAELLAKMKTDPIPAVIDLSRHEIQKIEEERTRLLFITKYGTQQLTSDVKPRDLFDVTNSWPPKVSDFNDCDKLRVVNQEEVTHSQGTPREDCHIDVKIKVSDCEFTDDQKQVPFAQIEAYGVQVLKQMMYHRGRNHFLPAHLRAAVVMDEESLHSVRGHVLSGNMENLSEFCKRVMDITEGSIIVTFKTETFEDVENLWKMYMNGTIGQLFQSLLKGPLMIKFSLKSLLLTTSVDEEYYLELKQLMLERELVVENEAEGKKKEDTVDKAPVQSEHLHKKALKNISSVDTPGEQDQILCEMDHNRLRRALPMLQQYLRPVTVIERLYSCGAISQFDREDMDAVTAIWRKSGMLCDVLLRSSQQTFDQFIQKLKETGQTPIVGAIMEERDPTQGELQSSPITLPEDYIENAKIQRSKLAQKSNKRLIQRFGLQRSTGIFYSKLCLAPHSLKHVTNREEYVKRTAAKMITWDHIGVGEIFDPSANKDGSLVSPRSVLLLGVAGMGKTTATQHIAQHLCLSEGHPFPTNILFRFECRALGSSGSTQERLSLAELIFKHHGPDTTDHTAYDVMRALNSPTTVVIFDGLDELDSFQNFNPCDHLPLVDPFTKCTVPGIIQNIMDGNLLPEARIIFTSRPNNNVTFDDFDRVVVILGFHQLSISNCLLEICDNDKDMHTKIMRHLDDTKLYTHCYVPLTCVILGVLLKSSLKGEQVLSSLENMDRFTHIYILFTYQLLKVLQASGKSKMRHQIRITQDNRNSMRRLQNLAAYGTLHGKEKKIIFDSEDLDKHIKMEIDEDVGLLEFLSDDSQKCVASFIHLSYQEFLTAAWLAINWPDEQLNQMFDNMEGGTDNDMILQYLAGFLGDHTLGHQFLQHVGSEVSEEVLSGRGIEVIDRIHRSALDEVDQENSRRLRVLMLMCVSEGKFKLMEQWKMTQLDLSGAPGGLLPNQLLAVSYYLKFNILEHLSLESNNITIEGASVLVVGLKRATSLSKFCMRNNPLEDKGVKLISSEMRENIGIKELRFGWTGLGYKELPDLDALLKNNRELEILELGEKLSQRAVNKLHTILTEHRRLKSIVLAGPEISAPKDLKRLVDGGQVFRVEYESDQEKLNRISAIYN